VAAVPPGPHAANFPCDDWAAYTAVNRKFAEAVCKEAESDDPVVLVQDYHFALARASSASACPAPPSSPSGTSPGRISSALAFAPGAPNCSKDFWAAGIVGFQTQLYCNNSSTRWIAISKRASIANKAAVIQHGQSALVRPYPISIAWPNDWALSAPPSRSAGAASLPSWACPRTPAAILGRRRRSPRLHQRHRRALSRGRTPARTFPAYLGRFTFVQLAAPTRSLIEHYRQLDSDGGKDRGPHQRPLRPRGLQAHPPLAHAPRTADGVPFLPRRRPVLRLELARRHRNGGGKEKLFGRAHAERGRASSRTAERASRKSHVVGLTTRRHANPKFAMARAAAPMLRGLRVSTRTTRRLLFQSLAMLRS